MRIYVTPRATTRQNPYTDDSGRGDAALIDVESIPPGRTTAPVSEVKCITRTHDRAPATPTPRGLHSTVTPGGL